MTARSDTPVTPHIIIIGCGFAGLEAAKALVRAPVRITLVDCGNHHLFQPLLYQVATAGLSSTSIAAPIRHIFRHQKNLTVLMAEVTAVDTSSRTIACDGGRTMAYDALIAAAGATHSYFGHDEWAEHAPGLKTLDDALRVRRRVLRAFEEAEGAATEEQRQLCTTFVVVGAGATGVEMAGTLAEIARHTLTDEFRNFNPAEARIVLLDGGDRVLPAFRPELSSKAQLQLERLGVVVRLNARVTGINAEGVALLATGKEERIDARTVIWAAGVKAVPLGRTLGVTLDRMGRVPVGEDLSIAGHPEVFVAGDLASAQSRGTPVPGVSPAAKQMGRCAALNALRVLAQKPTAPFVYRDYGSLATIGRKAAVAQMGRFKFWGLPAWLLWLCAHVYFLIGFRNRLVVLLDWAWAYLSFQRYARIILGAGVGARSESPPAGGD